MNLRPARVSNTSPSVTGCRWSQRPRTSDDLLTSTVIWWRRWPLKNVFIEKQWKTKRNRSKHISNVTNENILLKQGRQQTTSGQISTGSVPKPAAPVQIRPEVVWSCLSIFLLWKLSLPQLNLNLITLQCYWHIFMNATFDHDQVVFKN